MGSVQEVSKTRGGVKLVFNIPKCPVRGVKYKFNPPPKAMKYRSLYRVIMTISTKSKVIDAATRIQLSSSLKLKPRIPNTKVLYAKHGKRTEFVNVEIIAFMLTVSVDCYSCTS